MEIRGGVYWFRKRIIAVIIPYAIIQICLCWPFNEFSFSGFLLDIFCIKPRYRNGWYLSYLVTWYIVFYAVMRIKPLYNKRLIIFSIVSIIMLITLQEIRAEQSFSFFMGVLFSEYKNSDKLKINLKRAIALIFTGIVFLGLKQSQTVRQLPQIIFNIVQLMIKLPIALGLMTYIFILSKKINMKFLSYVGMISYELYILHGYILENVRHTALGALIFMLTSSASAIGYWFVMKKSNKYLKKMFGMK